MGLTECASVAFANPLDPGARKIGSPGRPLGMEARVVAPDGAVLGDRRARRDRIARRQRDAGLPQGSRGDGADAAPRRLARDRRSRLSRRRRLLLHHRPPEGAHHQGRREHRAARDRRGAAAAPRGAGGGGGGHSRSRIRAGDPRLRRAEAGRRVLGGRAARPLPDRARPLQDAEGVPFPRRAAEGAVGQGAAAEAGGGRGRRRRSERRRRDGGAATAGS